MVSISDDLPFTWLNTGLATLIIAMTVHTTFNDVLLRSYYLVVLYDCVCIFTIFCLFIFSKLCVIRRKPKVINLPVWFLFDSDLEFEDTLVFHEEPKWANYCRNFISICKFRPVYGLIAGLGFASLVSAIAIFAFSWFARTPSKDLISTGSTLFLTSLFLEVVVFGLAANLKVYDYKPPKDTYEPFSEFVKIPMKIFAAKVFAFMSSRVLYTAGSLFFLLSTVYSSIMVWNMPEKEVARLKEALEAENIHLIMICLMIVANIVGLSLLVENFLVAYVAVKENLLGIFEKNWERNLKAIDFLLPEAEVATLEQLRDVWANKSKQEQLRTEEKNAVLYVSKPLWKTKRAFLDKPVRQILPAGPVDLPEQGTGEADTPAVRVDPTQQGTGEDDTPTVRVDPTQQGTGEDDTPTVQADPLQQETLPEISPIRTRSRTAKAQP